MFPHETRSLSGVGISKRCRIVGWWGEVAWLIGRLVVRRLVSAPFSRRQDHRYTLPDGARAPEAVAYQATSLIDSSSTLFGDLGLTKWARPIIGLLWRNGYESGAIKAPIYADVLPALQHWISSGKKVLVYSSGSVAAQKLLFKYTDTPLGDMMPLFSGYYDTVNAGLKQEPSSYKNIIAKEAIEPEAWLFLSDNVKEVEAAKAAGMDSIVLVRPGNAVLEDGVRDAHAVVDTFADIAI